MTSWPDLDRVLSLLACEDSSARRSLNLTPSENVLSPLARLPFVLDGYSRYYFDHLRMFGAWSFFGALEHGQIEDQVLLPLLRNLAAAEYITVQPISGLNGMTVAMSALANPGDTVLTMPLAAGGHMSTARVAGRLGLRQLDLPMLDEFTVDLDGLKGTLAQERPALIYLDQSTVLFPVDIQPLRAVLDSAGSSALLHVDTSHLNGLVLGGALANPLHRGADSFGGSTHKTLPGPHKAFLATRNADIAERFAAAAGDLVSHHQPAAVASLAITLLEFRDCGGDRYARQVVKNAQSFAAALAQRGLQVVGADRGYTACHQLWVDPGTADSARAAEQLYAAGVRVNRVGVPGIKGSALRLSVAEVTRLGAEEEAFGLLAGALADALDGTDPINDDLAQLRAQLDRPRFCFDTDDLPALPEELSRLVDALFEITRHAPGVHL